MLSKSTISAVAGAAAIGFIGYCVYFDRKRRSDPNFKQALREKRRKNRQSGSGGEAGAGGMSQIPNLKDTEAMQRFFLQEVQLGEELLASGDIDQGVEHLSNAVAVCGQPQQLLGVLQQTLPAQVFQLLIQRMPQASQRIMSASATATTPSSAGHELDLE